jgi:dihydroflavonol-4-reductase
LRRGYAVRALVRPGSSTANLRGLAVEQAPGDLRDQASLAAALAGCDSLVHAAADYRLWSADPEALYRTNVEGTDSLMSLAAQAGLSRVVYTSSVATLFTDPSDAWGDEQRPAELRQLTGHYKRSKWLAEQRVLGWAERGLPVVVVNPTAPLGPGDVKPTPTGRIVLDALSGRMPAYVDTGLNVVHVDDVAEGHVLALERGEPGSRYVLGGENMTLKALLTEVCAACGRRPPRIRLPVAAVLPVAGVCELAARVLQRPPAVSLESVRLARNKMFFTSDKAARVLGYRWRPAGQAIADSASWFQQRRSGA